MNQKPIFSNHPPLTILQYITAGELFYEKKSISKQSQKMLMYTNQRNLTTDNCAVNKKKYEYTFCRNFKLSRAEHV